MGQRLQNKVALITGGTSGIGEATAELFAAEGAKVVITGRSEEKGARIAERLGENVLYLRADAMQEQDIEASVNFTVERFGTLDVLFNNAGGSVGRERLDEISQEHIDYAVRLLLSSVILGVRYAVEPMKANGGGVQSSTTRASPALRYGQGGPLVLHAQGGRDALHEACRSRARPLRHPCQRDLTGNGRDAHFLGRFGAGQDSQR